MVQLHAASVDVKSLRRRMKSQNPSAVILRMCRQHRPVDVDRLKRYVEEVIVSLLAGMVVYV